MHTIKEWGRDTLTPTPALFQTSSFKTFIFLLQDPRTLELILKPREA